MKNPRILVSGGPPTLVVLGFLTRPRTPVHDAVVVVKNALCHADANVPMIQPLKNIHRRSLIIGGWSTKECEVRYEDNGSRARLV